ncbi:hypothetical protein Back2_23990 [Nocardioides baekrokdamisoli]|uniref:ABC transporter domain-containing protein n=1 Tax=Nocardioides baekrokdamisoli TaxID=1804624 RepID=A0A3G9IIW8_9ACTN|nr:ABC transporter ATP-binding protein [Nocardioides baekrokdamisoli]BBH18112.1 hypothetical protein Back2_23990 [Nocardioides baekrokdamisoli]
MTALIFDGVTVRYGRSVPAVGGVDLVVQEGHWTGLIGPNGAGKSSLLRAATGLVPHTGTIAVASGVLRGLSWRERARQIAYVPQQPELPAEMSVLDYVLLGRTPHISYLGRESAHDRQVCLDLLERIGMSPFAERPLGTLSGGEVQRVVIARALAQEAPVLLLDEPTSALDIGRRVEALELVDGLRRERGLTVLSVLHDLTLASQFADSLALLVEGRVIAAGAPPDVCRPEVLQTAFGAAVGVLTDGDGRLLVVPQRSMPPRAESVSDQPVPSAPPG